MWLTNGESQCGKINQPRARLSPLLLAGVFALPSCSHMYTYTDRLLALGGEHPFLNSPQHLFQPHACLFSHMRVTWSVCTATHKHRFIAKLVTLSACFGLYKATGGVTEEIRAPLCRDVTHSPQMFRTTKKRASRLTGGRKEGLKENREPVRSSTLMDDNISDGNCDEYQCGC